MKKSPQNKALPIRATSRRGFTLIEVLTVIAIIAILMAAGAIGLGNLSAGKGTASAIASCEALFEEARTIAVSNRCKARVMVLADDPSKENYLQRVVIIYEEMDADGKAVPNSWIISSRGYDMPKGVYFSQIYSKAKDANDSDIPLPEFTLSSTKTDYAGKYFYYEFNAEGIFANAGSSFVIGAGVRPKNQNPKTTASSKRDFVGFVVWRNGRTSTFRSTSQMPNLPNSNQSFNF